MIKRLLGLVCSLCLLVGGVGCSASRSAVTLCDNKGEVIATVSKMKFSSKDLVKKGYSSYVEYVLNESVAALAKKNDCSEDEAEKLLFSQPLTINTAFDKEVYQAIEQMYEEYKKQMLPLGCAITDHKGNVCAVFSGGDKRYGLESQSPYSAIKPLSVYAPALERGMIDWTTQFTDKPYKQIIDNNGNTSDWPKNVSGYTYKDVTVAQAVKKSLNTIAVHCLAQMRVNYSISFLQTSFDMNLDYELNKSTLEGAKEVLGNVGLGYLYKGVTPVELAGYYQIFANGGNYTKTHAISEIKDSKGKVIYKNQEKARKIIREDTAYIMNRLLREVVLPGGTGEKAAVKDVIVAGKTGTATDSVGNWFVGITPQYSCAVWHGATDGGNIAPKLFSQVFDEMPNLTSEDFTPCDSVKRVVCCSESGKKFSSSCTNMYVGYFAADRTPADCDKH